MSLVGSMSFPFYLAAMRRPDLGKRPTVPHPGAAPAEPRGLHRIVQDWIWTFSDMESLDAQMDEAKIATGRLRTVKEFADSDWARDWNAVRTVSDRSGGEIRIPGRPWHFADQVAPDRDAMAAHQGEHNAAVLSEIGFTEAEIGALEAAGAMIEPGKCGASRLAPSAGVASEPHPATAHPATVSTGPESAVSPPIEAQAL